MIRNIMINMGLTFRDVPSHFHGAQAWDSVGVLRAIRPRKKIPIRDFVRGKSRTNGQTVLRPDTHRAGKSSRSSPGNVGRIRKRCEKKRKAENETTGIAC